MKNDQLVTQIETYSNAIVGFFVVQAIAYCVSFGTNEMFNCLVKTANHLALGLSIHFCVSTVLACYATLFLKKQVLRLCQQNADIVSRIYLAKAVVIVLFSALPLGVTLTYGVMDYPNKTPCKQATRST